MLINSYRCDLCKVPIQEVTEGSGVSIICEGSERRGGELKSPEAVAHVCRLCVLAVMHRWSSISGGTVPL